MNIRQILDLTKSITNPKEAIRFTLLEMEKRDPHRARSIAKLISMGEKPTTAIKEAAQRGELNQQQLNKLKDGYKYLKGLGIKITVPNETWEEVSKIISENSQGSNSTTFSGF